MKTYLSLFLLILTLTACKTWEAQSYDFPKPVDTTDKAIQLQDKKVYEITSKGIYADNQFDGARLNDFQWLNDNLY